MEIFTYTTISITILSFISFSALSSASHQSLRGDVIKCNNEGQSVKVSLLSDDPCITCKCFHQEIVCKREDLSQCRVTHNLTRFSTFDGKAYSFYGRCNYILARDCKSKIFSVHLVNKYQNNSEIRNNSFFSGTTVMVKINDIKVRLGQSARVSVGRKRVRLPHVRLGVLSIVNDSHKVVIRANIGLKIIWDFGNSIEITVPSEFKSKTCGLCGNYNNNPNDDFITKRGKIYTEIEKFAYSWKVGKNVICDSPVNMTEELKERVSPVMAKTANTLRNPYRKKPKKESISLSWNQFKHKNTFKYKEKNVLKVFNSFDNQWN